MSRSLHLSGPKDHECGDQQQESSLHSWQEAHGVHRSEKVLTHIYIFIQSPTKKIEPLKKTLASHSIMYFISLFN